MRSTGISLIEQMTRITRALLGDKSGFEPYEADNVTHELVIDDVKSMAGSLLLGMRIRFHYTPVNNREAVGHPTEYRLYIGYQRTDGTVKTALITLEALLHDEWVHQPLRNVFYVAERLKESGL